MQYDHYLLDEVLPLTRPLNANPYLIVTGASFGGYHAVNFALKHPEQVGRLLSMSGLCDIRRFADGYSDRNLYLNNPVDFLAGEHDTSRLDALRHMDIILAVGRDDSLCISTNGSRRYCGARISGTRCASGRGSPMIGRCGKGCCNCT